MEYYLDIKQNEILPFATAWRDLENIMLSKQASQRKTSAIWFHLYVVSNEQNKLPPKIGTDRDREQADSCQRGGELEGWVKRLSKTNKQTNS